MNLACLSLQELYRDLLKRLVSNYEFVVTLPWHRTFDLLSFATSYKVIEMPRNFCYNPRKLCPFLQVT